jgi:TonB family protein
LAIHVAGALLAVVGVDLSFLEKPREEQIVEVTFGLEVPSRVNAAPQPKTVDPAAESPPQPDQGTKLPEQLPQLPERFDINTKQPEPVAEDLPAPEQPTELEQPVATPVAKPEPTPLPATPAPNAIVAEERDKDARKIDMKDVIDRMKREDRKVADKDKEGPNKIPDSPLSKPSDLPPNPLADAPIPNMPDALAPSGSLAGRKLAGSALEAYRTAALVHMKRNWNIPGVYSFSADIEAVAVVVVDLFGKIRSLEIDKSSGNVAFDEVVLKQIQAAEPFPDFPDDSARTQKIYMKFKPQSID